MALKKSDFLVCKECGMYGDRDCFEDKSGPTCKQCTRVHCLQMSLDEAKESSKAVEKTLALVLERLSKLEGECGQKKEGQVAGMRSARARPRRTQAKSRNKKRQLPAKGKAECCWSVIPL